MMPRVLVVDDEHDMATIVAYKVRLLRRAFDLGTDDDLTKLFDHLELLARLRALLRRIRAPLRSILGKGPIQRLRTQAL